MGIGPELYSRPLQIVVDNAHLFSECKLLYLNVYDLVRLALIQLNLFWGVGAPPTGQVPVL